MPEYEVFSGPYFPVFRPEKSPYWGIFHAVINPFVPNASFLYPLKTTENYKVFWCFQWVEKRCTGNEWVIFFCFQVSLSHHIIFLVLLQYLSGDFLLLPAPLFWNSVWGSFHAEAAEKYLTQTIRETRSRWEQFFFWKTILY